MNDFGPKLPMSESAENAPTDIEKAKRGRPKKKPDYDRENVRKKACTRLTCSRICDILESWETVALAALIIANLYTVSSRQQSKDRLRCEEEYNGLKYMKNNPSLNSVHQYTQQPFIHPPHHTHPEERIWAGRTPRVPDAPRIKHDKMKQFYMVDMRRKRW